MKINDFATLPTNIILERHYREADQLLESVCQGLTADQKRIVEGINKELRVLIEVSLSPEQISQLFTNVQASKANRSLVGKGVDVAKKANEIVNNVGKWLQDTTPVKFADQKFEQLKKVIAGKYPNLDTQLTSLGAWMKENPGKSAAIIGVLTAISALSAGPVGGAIAGQVLRGASELIKGEKLSTAAGRGLKTAAIGWLAGFTMDKIGDMISSVYQSFNPIPIRGSNLYYESNIGNGLPSIFRDAKIYGNQEQVNQFHNMWGQAVRAWRGGNYEAAGEMFANAQKFATKITADTLAKIAIEGDPTEKIGLLNKVLGGLAAAAQGAASGATSVDKSGTAVRESMSKFFTRVAKLQNESAEVNRVLNLAGINEGIFDRLKSFGTSLTNKVTADQLMKAWEAAGKPTESEKIIEIMKQAGVSDEVVNQVLTDMGIPAPAETPPAETPPTATTGETPAAPATKPTLKEPKTTDEMINAIQSLLAQLKKSDATKYPELIKTLKENKNKPVTKKRDEMTVMTLGGFPVTPLKITNQEVDEALKVDIPQTQLSKKDLQDYLTRIKTDTKTKADRFKPIIHANNIKAIVKDDQTEWDLNDLAEQITTKPNSILGSNAKMSKSKKEGAITYDLTLPALNGIVVDEEASTADNPVFVEVETCPGAGECKTYCYARKGGYVMFPAPSMSAARALNFLLNHPEDYMEMFDDEVKEAKARADKAKIKLLVRIHDAGDFFSKEYYDLAMDVAKNNPDVRFYFYSKMGDIVTDQNAPANVVKQFSPGAKSKEVKTVTIARGAGKKIKDAVTLQKDFFRGLFKTNEKGKYIKDEEGRTIINSPEDWEEFKTKLADRYGIDRDSIITYDQMVKIPEGPKPKWNVVIFPAGHGDLGAPRLDVENQFLMFH